MRNLGHRNLSNSFKVSQVISSRGQSLRGKSTLFENARLNSLSNKVILLCYTEYPQFDLTKEDNGLLHIQTL